MAGARQDQRGAGDLRPVSMTRGFLKFADGSCLMEVGHTRVVCSATIEEKVPQWMQEKGSGWVTAEYGMLPRSTHHRTPREAVKGVQGGRTQEIQRLIGRSLRAVVDLEKLGPRSIWIDCDVLQADGGTRTASITGAYVALVDALALLKKQGVLKKLPLKDQVAAVSAGLITAEPWLDLTYPEDSRAQVDLNVVMTGSGQLVEVQGTGEGGTFTEAQLDQLMALAKTGIRQLIQIQRDLLKDLLV